MPTVSIVMSTFNRPKLLLHTLHSMRRQSFTDYEVVLIDDGTDTETATIASQFPFVRYYRSTREPHEVFHNPARPINAGIRLATGNYIILQSPECEHKSPELIEALVVRTKPDGASLASVAAMNQAGTEMLVWYTHSTLSPRPFFFCGCIERRHLLDINGFDEDYIEYGMEDVDLADRLMAKGIRFEYHDDIRADHQWHPAFGHHYSTINNDIYLRKTAAMTHGELGIIRNLNKEWGKL